MEVGVIGGVFGHDGEHLRVVYYLVVAPYFYKFVFIEKPL
jgi:hypothetical protein